MLIQLPSVDVASADPSSLGSLLPDDAAAGSLGLRSREEPLWLGSEDADLCTSVESSSASEPSVRKKDISAVAKFSSGVLFSSEP
mmetsp:Transcript_26792/g.42984  ORF Transcript_26792/g.42984 Transcript_26792/m.42984 type:complete len:85 (-) Transcript_26792:39-293(-)